MEGIIHIVALNPRELWIEGKDVVRMEKTPSRYEWNGHLMKITYEDGHVENIHEPVIVEIIGQNQKELNAEISDTEETPPPAKDGKPITA